MAKDIKKVVIIRLQDIIPPDQQRIAENLGEGILTIFTPKEDAKPTIESFEI